MKGKLFEKLLLKLSILDYRAILIIQFISVALRRYLSVDICVQIHLA